MNASFRLSVHRSPAATEDALSSTVTIRVPSDLEVVEEAVDLVARHCLASGLGARAARFNLRVALAEALSNAIVYGNRQDPSKAVDVRIEVASEDIAVHVCDEGPGFDPATIADPTLPDNIDRIDGRGLFLIRQLVDAVSFNDRGNSICMKLRRA